MKKLILFLMVFSTVLTATTPAKQDRKPSSIPDANVQVGGNDEFDACGGTGIVIASTTLFGYDKAGIRTFGKVDLNQIAFLCEESEDGEYLGIVFGKKDQDCKVGSPIKTKQVYSGPCKSGWIKKSFFEFLAG